MSQQCWEYSCPSPLVDWGKNEIRQCLNKSLIHRNSLVVHIAKIAMILNIFKKKMLLWCRCFLHYWRHHLKMLSETEERWPNSDLGAISKTLFSSPESDRRSSHPVPYVRQKHNVEHPQKSIDYKGSVQVGISFNVAFSSGKQMLPQTKSLWRCISFIGCW